MTGANGPRLIANMLYGLDHAIVPYPSPPRDNCEDPSKLPAAQYDDVYRPWGNNCIIGDPGNNGPNFATH